MAQQCARVEALESQACGESILDRVQGDGEGVENLIPINGPSVRALDEPRRCPLKRIRRREMRYNDAVFRLVLPTCLCLVRNSAFLIDQLRDRIWKR